MLDGISFADLSAPALLGITVLLLLLGRLVPRSTLQDKADEAEKWRKAYETERDSRITASAQSAELLEVGKMTYSIVSAAFGAELMQKAGAMWGLFRRKSEAKLEAERALQKAQNAQRAIEARGPEVTQVAKALKEIRERNHFAERLQGIIERSGGTAHDA